MDDQCEESEGQSTPAPGLQPKSGPQPASLKKMLLVHSPLSYLWFHHRSRAGQRQQRPMVHAACKKYLDSYQKKLYFSDPLNVSRGKIEQKNMLLGGCTMRHSVAQGWGWGVGV